MTSALRSRRGTTLADILARWKNREAERKRARTDQSFLVPKSEIAENDYDLSVNRYKEVEYEAVEYDPPKVILERLAGLEEEITERAGEVGGVVGMIEARVQLGDVAGFINGVAFKPADWEESGRRHPADPKPDRSNKTVQPDQSCSREEV